MSSGSKRGFSLVEALVAVAITGVGVTAALGGLKALAQGDTRARQVELMQRLAFEKYEEVVATAEFKSAPLTGDFNDRNVPGYTFRVEAEPSATENLQIVRVTVAQADDAGKLEGRATGLVFVPPIPVEDGQ
ncbi:MAG: prepilin-type N-terminal cleavage/methylation domain-containing protein [Fimbriimonadaceae bacterium]